MSNDTYFCHIDAPAELKDAVRDIDKMKRWVKPPRSDAELDNALLFIHLHHNEQRQLVKDEIAKRGQESAIKVGLRANVLSAIAIAVSVVALLVSFLKD